MENSNYTIFEEVKSHISFDTGRFYDFKQNIVAYHVGDCPIGSPVVYIKDKSRKMDGLINPIDFSPSQILSEYDSGVDHPTWEIKQMVERYESVQ